MDSSRAGSGARRDLRIDMAIAGTHRARFDRLDRKGEDLPSREASGGGEDAQTDHPDPPGDPRGLVQRFDRDVPFERLGYPEDDSGLGLVDVSFAFHTPILRDVRKPRPRFGVATPPMGAGTPRR